MAEDISTDQKNVILFLQLVMTFESAAWQQMGKIKNPLTDKIERDLDQAQLSIDMLDMIKARTAGNLSDDEKRVLERAISELKLNFVEELEKDRKEKEKQAQEKKEPAEEKTEEKPQAKEAAEKDEKKAEEKSDKS